ncbi:MAG: DUF1467 domain-containing protein [Hyphomicrobiales bacterium]|nr:MAG: DUF1467 domain-containing protein [Hyphomicrobiales bacterium]
MSIGSSLALYFIIWWLTLFAVLPWGVKTQAEDGAVTPGSVPSAPARPHLLKKILWTTLIAGLLFAAIYHILTVGYSLDDLPAYGPK